MDDQTLIQELERRIAAMADRQNQFQKEITELRQAVATLKQKLVPIEEIKPLVEKAPEIIPGPVIIEQAFPKPEPKAAAPKVVAKKVKTPLEEFIGTNLLNKVGIAILVIGISFGVKYSIDHDLINPLTRIILGYLAGGILIGIALRLKPKYETFSAVLLSGGMASLYFITYAAYDLYQLFPQVIAFILMLLFTAFTVFAALQYNLQAIAIIGLVGAYAIPFLLSDGSGRIIVLFTYMAIINAGILVLAFKKYWKLLYNLAFIFTWIIYSAWWGTNYHYNEHLVLSLVFSTIFFVTFYAAFLSYKLIKNEKLVKWDIAFLLLNSFVYFGFGYYSVASHPSGEVYLGLFTLFNAVLHFIVCVVIFKRQGQEKDTFYFVAGMVLVFLTLAVPVQLEGKWVTIIWSAEAALLYWIGRSKNFLVYESLSYPLVLLSFGSLLQDWDVYYDYYDKSHTTGMIFLNVQFLTSMLVCAAFTWMVRIDYTHTRIKETSALQKVQGFVLPSLLLLTLYLSFFKEVDNFWQQKYLASAVEVKGHDGADGYTMYDNDMMKLKHLWLLNYSALFGLALGIISLRFIKNKYVIITSLSFNVLILALFLFNGLLYLSDLRNSYLSQTDSQYYFRDLGNIIIRYVSIALILPLIWVNRKHIKNDFFDATLKKIELALLHIFILTLLSSELVHWLEMARVENSFKLGLSILWGAYALFLIIQGLRTNEKYIRVMAITLFGITLVKLFLYDMNDMSTIAKTIVMIVLGALLLVASFLYNKVKKSSEHEA